MAALNSAHCTPGLKVYEGLDRTTLPGTWHVPPRKISHPPRKKKTYGMLFPSSLSPTLRRVFPSIGLLCACGITQPTPTTRGGNGNGAPPTTRAIRIISACRRLPPDFCIRGTRQRYIIHSSDPHDDLVQGAMDCLSLHHRAVVFFFVFPGIPRK